MNVIKERDRKKVNESINKFPSYIQQYIDHMFGKNSSPTTLEGYLSDFNMFLSWLINEHLTTAQNIAEVPLVDLEKLKVTDITRYSNFLRDKKPRNVLRSRTKKIYALKSLFHYLSQIAEDDDFYPLLKRNVMAKVEASSANSKPDLKLLGPKLLLDNEIDEFIHFISVEYRSVIANNKQALYNYDLNRERDVAVIGFILGSGLRVSEIVNLDLDDIYMDKLTVAVQRKGDNDEDQKTGVIFTEEAGELLRIYLELREDRFKPSRRETALFLSIPNGQDQGIRYGKRGMQDMVIKYAKAFGKQTTIHKLRQSYATSFNKTNGIHKTKEQLGHKKFETTEIYALVSSEEMHEASQKYSQARKAMKDSGRNSE